MARRLHYRVLDPQGNKVGTFPNIGAAIDAAMYAHANALQMEDRRLSTEEALSRAADGTSFKKIVMESGYTAELKYEDDNPEKGNEHG